jgi:hypothetical protein
MHQTTGVLDFLMYVQKDNFDLFCFLQVLPSPCFFLPSNIISIAMFGKNKKMIELYSTAFLCHGPLAFVVREPLLPLSSQNPLDHDRG